MNYTRFISFTVLAAILSSCEFNEDFCIRNGELIAWCDFSGIRETPPVPEERHIIAFPSGMDIPSGEQMTFTQDTLRQSIPQGEYQFLFYTGNYEVSDIRDYHEARLMARTDTLEGEVYISGVQKFCCSAGFSQRLEYQRPKRVPITPSAFVQRLISLVKCALGSGKMWNHIVHQWKWDECHKTVLFFPFHLQN